MKSILAWLALSMTAWALMATTAGGAARPAIERGATSLASNVSGVVAVLR